MSSIIAKPAPATILLDSTALSSSPRWRSEPLRSKLSDHRRSCGNQTDAVSRSGIDALHLELRGQAALVLILAGNHTGEQQTIASRAAWGNSRHICTAWRSEVCPLRAMVLIGP